MQTDIEERVKRCVARQLGLRDEDVHNDAKIIVDLGADSLDAIELLMDIEDEFEIAVTDEDAEKVETVQQAIDYVTANAK